MSWSATPAFARTASTLACRHAAGAGLRIGLTPCRDEFQPDLAGVEVGDGVPYSEIVLEGEVVNGLSLDLVLAVVVPTGDLEDVLVATDGDAVQLDCLAEE